MLYTLILFPWSWCNDSVISIVCNSRRSSVNIRLEFPQSLIPFITCWFSGTNSGKVIVNNLFLLFQICKFTFVNADILSSFDCYIHRERRLYTQHTEYTIPNWFLEASNSHAFLVCSLCHEFRIWISKFNDKDVNILFQISNLNSIFPLMDLKYILPNFEF